jgi:hypothetical protein
MIKINLNDSRIEKLKRALWEVFHKMYGETCYGELSHIVDAIAGLSTLQSGKWAR